jgi:site-specific DNA-methyltransferase (adenine-specific)
VILNADSREALAEMAARGETVHSIVTDPPYGLTSVVKRFGKADSAPAKSDGATGVYKRASAGFMGQAWDGTGIEQDPAFWRLCYDVLKPGGFLLAFGGTRTWHRIACAIEDAGFEVRDTIMWLYGTGFPKSHDAARAVEAHLRTGGSRFSARDPALTAEAGVTAAPGAQWQESSRRTMADKADSGWSGGKVAVTLPEAATWQGWGTALKPAWEPIMVFRKPLIGTVAENALAHGTGALNIDACLVGETGGTKWVSTGDKGDVGQFGGGIKDGAIADAGKGRWPANVTHDGSAEVLEVFAVYGKAGGGFGTENRAEGTGIYGKFSGATKGRTVGYGDTGTAARFFYTAKASKNDRNTDWQGQPIQAENKHPTVKPTDLMRWVCRLVTPPGGTVLDPFAGSGSTGKAARMEGFRFIGIEADPAFAEVARQRIGFGSDFATALARLKAAIERNKEARDAAR